jgi:isoleucyl-tRNA synthetase
VPVAERPELDRWILSELNSMVKAVDEYYNDYEPTKAGRAIADFVDEHLSNWYVRLSRRRFWKGDYSKDKISAYQTLYTCLETLARLSAPIAPFFMERLFRDLNNVTGKSSMESVHHTEFPKPDLPLIDKALEERMEMAQKISSMVLSLRKKTNIRVRQPLNKILIPSAGERMTEQIEAVKNLILSEVNVKELEYITDTSAILVKRIKPDFKKLGPKYGRLMKQIAESVTNFTREDISALEKEGRFILNFNGQDVELTLEDVEIISEDIPGWLVTNMGTLTVALDITITPVLWEEGIARELINRIQNLRKDKGFEVTDKINVELQRNEAINQAIENNLSYICSETLSQSFVLLDEMNTLDKELIELTDGFSTFISIRKIE